MDLLTRLERALERTVEGFFARSFRGRVQPIAVAKRLAREMEGAKMVSVSGTYAPNRYRVLLNPADLEHFQPFREAMIAELTHYLREHAEQLDCHFMGPVQIELLEGPNLPEGELEVQGQVMAVPAEEDTRIRPRLKRAQFVVETGPESKRVFTLNQPVETIGRGADSSICLHDPTVSRRHAEVRQEGERYWLVDLGSTNRTQVNGQPITNVQLSDGDLVQLGASLLRFRIAQ